MIVLTIKLTNVKYTENEQFLFIEICDKEQLFFLKNKLNPYCLPPTDFMNGNKPIRRKINEIKKIEIKLLEKFSNYAKMPQYKLLDQLMSGAIKLHAKNNVNTINNHFILKISGIWETNNFYGLTYKFMKIETLPVGNIQ